MLHSPMIYPNQLTTTKLQRKADIQKLLLFDYFYI